MSYPPRWAACPLAFSSTFSVVEDEDEVSRRQHRQLLKQWQLAAMYGIGATSFLPAIEATSFPAPDLAEVEARTISFMKEHGMPYSAIEFNPYASPLLRPLKIDLEAHQQDALRYAFAALPQPKGNTMIYNGVLYAIPSEFTHIATDKGGGVFAYTAKPRLCPENEAFVCVGDTDYKRLGTARHPNWKDSLQPIISTPSRPVTYNKATANIPNEYNYLVCGKDGTAHATVTEPQRLGGDPYTWRLDGTQIKVPALNSAIKGVDFSMSSLYYIPLATQRMTGPATLQAIPKTRPIVYYHTLLQVPITTRFLAMDSDGSVYPYSEKPTLHTITFSPQHAVATKLAVLPSNSNWKDSIYELPPYDLANERTVTYRGHTFTLPKSYQYLSQSRNGAIKAHSTHPISLITQWDNISTPELTLVQGIDDINAAKVYDWEHSLVDLDQPQTRETIADVPQTRETIADVPQTSTRDITYRGTRYSVPNEFKFIATDSCGAVFAYTHEPKSNFTSDGWGCYKGGYKRLGLTPPCSDWRSSLYQIETTSQVQYRGQIYFLSPAFKFIATDEDGSIFVYTDEPTRSDGKWRTDNLNKRLTQPTAGYPAWRTSLQEIGAPTTREVEYNGRTYSLSVEFTHIATDKNGAVFAYTSKPTPRMSVWHKLTGVMKAIGHNYHPSWKNSLLDIDHPTTPDLSDFEAFVRDDYFVVRQKSTQEYRKGPSVRHILLNDFGIPNGDIEPTARIVSQQRLYVVPLEAKYVAVDDDGQVKHFTGKPICRLGCWSGPGYGSAKLFNTTLSPNSLKEVS